MKLSFLFILLIMFSCSPLRHLNKIQSDNQFKKTENLNFAAEKANTQWWYFDCLFDDGSILVFLFTPHQWWNENEKTTTDQSLFYISYMNGSGEVKSISKVFDYKEFSYDKNSLKSPYFHIVKSHEKNKRTYTIKFNVDEMKGSAIITSGSKGFSPFPTGSMGKLATRHILKLKGKDLAFRYASHVPQGKINCQIKINETYVNLSGKAYHEQGWFNGSAHQMGKGWTWFHFVSKNVNVFGKPGGFLYLEKEGKRVLGGISKECILSDTIYADKTNTFMVGGKLNYLSKKRSFEIVSTGKASTPLINIPSIDTHQLWGTVVQPSVIYWNEHGKVLVEEGLLLLETCKMSKDGKSIVKSTTPTLKR